MTSEVVETGKRAVDPARFPMLEIAHRNAGAVMREQDGRTVPAHYGDARVEYEAVRGDGAGLFDLSSRGRVEVSGSEAEQFLDGMVTNDVVALENGAWMHVAFPNVQARLLASSRVMRLESSRFLIDTEPATRERVLSTLERFTLAGDFRVRDTSLETAMLSIQGAGAEKIVAAVLGEKSASTARGRVNIATLHDSPINVIRATHTAEDGFDLAVSAADAGCLWDALVSEGARPAGFDALEVLRIEAGIPSYGVDASDANVVSEIVNEDETVSYTKKCYLGQEIIARIHWRGHVAKKLAGVVLDREVEVPVDSKIRSVDGEKEVGRITSSIYSPRLKTTVALATIKYDHLAPGTEVRIVAGDEQLAMARVAELPLVRGSWYESEPARLTEDRGADR